MIKHLLSVFAFTLALATFPNTVLADTHRGEKEWTFLLFLNGHNNLDTYGAMNINQMEQIGSSDKVNLLVQWASYSAQTTKRLYVEKDADNETVTSPVIQDLPRVDMGDYKELTNFIKWGVDNYPAKKYFVGVWNHGNGWHLKPLVPNLRGGFQVQDISYDDFTGNVITTEQLAQSLSEGAKYIGHKIDVYASDACLMAMAEVGSEMADSVRYMVGSQELEPGEGWPYHTFLSAWYSLSDMSAANVSTALVTEYAKAYTMGGTYAEEYSRDVTMSAMDLGKIDTLHNSLAALSKQLQKISPEEMVQVKAAIDETKYFTGSDYRDLKDFLIKLKATPVGKAIKGGSIEEVDSAVGNLVISNQTVETPDAYGVAFWIPGTYDYQAYGARYEGLNFHKQTGWGDFLKILNATPE